MPFFSQRKSTKIYADAKVNMNVATATAAFVFLILKPRVETGFGDILELKNTIKARDGKNFHQKFKMYGITRITQDNNRSFITTFTPQQNQTFELRLSRLLFSML